MNLIAMRYLWKRNCGEVFNEIRLFASAAHLINRIMNDIDYKFDMGNLDDDIRRKPVN